MLKVRLINKVIPKKEKKDKYPCLMVGSGGSLVLMTGGQDNMGVGTLLLVTDGIGSNELYTSTGMWPLAEFTLYKGKFVIENDN